MVMARSDPMQVGTHWKGSKYMVVAVVFNVLK